MGIFNRLATLGFQWAFGSDGKHALGALQNYLNDPTQALPLAIEQAEQKSWLAIELALDQRRIAEFKKLVASGTLKRALSEITRHLEQQSTDFKKRCLQQVKAIQQDKACRVDLSECANSLHSFHQPQQLLGEAQQALVQSIQSLQDYPELATLLQWRAEQDLPLFLTLFGYFLRVEIAADARLCQLVDLKQTLDVQVWLKQVAENDPAHELGKKEQSVLNRANASNGAVQRGLSCSLYSPMEQQLLKELLANYRNLPTLQQIEFASLLNGLGKIALATGDFSQAREYFAEAASNLQDKQAQAELAYNQHCVALEQKAWADALSLLHEAVALDAERFEPFPFKRYQAERILGAGGFGTAFLCVDTFLDRRVVIKTLQREELSRDVKEVFREGHLLRQLNHPFIVKLEDCDFADVAKTSRPYLVMEYVDALSLELYLEQQKQPLSVAQGRKLAVQLAEALQAAHQQNILHRDVKPANVLLKAGSLDLKLIDFGLGLRLQSVQRSVLGTNLNQSILGRSAAGTVEFAAPEQMGLTTNLNVKSVGTYSDVYGFGKTLCYALFLNAQPNRKDWDKLNDVQFADALSECIAREPSERPQNFEMVLKLLAAREETVVEAEVSPKPQPKAVPESESLGIFAAIERAWQWLYRTVVSFFKSLILIVVVVGVIGAIVGDKKDKSVKQVVPPAPAPQAQAEPPVAPKPTPVVTRLEFEPETVAIPAGTFEMGSNDGASDETPVHSVSVNGFWMSKYEVTVGQFKAFMQDTGYTGVNVSEYDCNGLMNPKGFTPADNHPVSCVHWKDAEAYTAWLSKKTGKTYRLPTEAEWEYAARAGSTTKWYFGNDESRLGEYAWYGANSGSQTHAVGQKKPNDFGLYDMAGNVWEWTCSEYAAYSEGKETKCASGGDTRLLRGGSWLYNTFSCRSAYRNDNSLRNYIFGFRVVSLPPATLPLS